MGSLQRLDRVGAEPMLAGALLRQARVASGLSLGDIAATTRVSRDFLLGLESNEIDAEIAPAYAIGYARAYARTVGVPEEIAVTDIRRIVAKRPPRRATRLATSPATPRFASIWWGALGIAAIAACAILIAWLVLPL